MVRNTKFLDSHALTKITSQPSGISKAFMCSPHPLWKKWFWQESLLKLSKLLVFSLTSFKIKIKTIQWIKSRFWEKKEGKHADSRQVSGHSHFSYARYAEKLFTQIYRDLYGDAMLVPIRMGTNMAAGNQQKHLLLSFATKAWIYFSINSKTLK